MQKIFNIIINLFSYLFAWIVAISLVGGGFWFYDEIYSQTPEISLEKLEQRPQTTTITDRNGGVLFKIYDENREYVHLEKINQNMINALVSIEDERFWKHNWIDYRGILRAMKHNIQDPKNLQGASTIEQQLVRNIFLTKEQTLKRKLKEMVLTFKFNNFLEKNIKEKNNKTTQNVKKERKDKILELYLNYIPFWNNTFGIQTASKRYFNTDAKNLTILQSSILASLPKATTLYNPYTHRNDLMGFLRITHENHYLLTDPKLYQKVKTKISPILQEKIMKLEKINKNKVSLKEQLSQIKNTMHSNFVYSWENYHISYVPGRKDLVLTKMLENNIISFEEYKKALSEGINFQFFKWWNYIKAPHFVFYVLNLLEKEWGSELVRKWWLTIKTTLDLPSQLELEKALQENKKLEEYHANNNANLTINSKNGDILIYLWSKDFWNQKIEWQNDMILAKRQLGSVLKPLFYAKAFDDLHINRYTIIRDEPIKIGNIYPRNYDNRFLKNIPIRKALSYSRNIPAIKLFYKLGGEKFTKGFFKKLGIKSLNSETYYWFSLVLWGAEMQLLELANAYSHLATESPQKINPILEIRDKTNTIIYQKNLETEKKEEIKEEKKEETQQKSIFSAYARKETSDILSNPNNFEKWVKYRLKKYKIPFAIKSGTSAMNTSKWVRSRDAVLAGYNKDYVTIFWAGNTDWSPMTADAYWFFMNIDPLGKISEILNTNQF